MIESHNPFQMEIVVASLMSSIERRQRVERMFQPLPYRWRFFDACVTPPADLPYDVDRTILEKGRTLSPAELGTFNTHFSILKHFATDGSTPYLMILEDDVQIDPGFWFHRLPDFMRQAGIDMLRLYARFLFDSRWIIQVSERHTLMRFKRPFLGAQAYVVSRAGAQRLVSSIRRVIRPCDDEFDRFWENQLPLYAIYPFPVIELEGPSTISDRNNLRSPLTWRQRILREAFRYRSKYARKAANRRMYRQDQEIRARLKDVRFP